jgi:predicted Zn-dependent peptidase
LPSVRGREPQFKKTVLDNGIRVVTENHPYNRAVSCGVWVTKGTRDELPHESGLAHFVEHMVFKRTKKRSAYKISRDMEAVGGELNAFTSRESTTFVSHSLSEHLSLSLDVLSDLVCNPSFVASDIKKEKQVVIQEIHMCEDQLEEAVFDYFFAQGFADTNLGGQILGSVKSIEGLRRSTIQEFHARQYANQNIVVSIAGNLNHDKAVSLVTKYLRTRRPPAQKARARAIEEPMPSPIEMQSFREVMRRPSEQVHIMVGMPAANFRDSLRFEAFIANTLLGGGMTSRLYQTVREDRGLVYSIYSQLVTFIDTGVNLIYAGTEPKKTPEVVELIFKELRKLKKSGVKKSEVELFKTQVKASILLGADDVENRMNSMAVNEIVFGRYRSIEEVIKDIDQVTTDSVHEYIEHYIKPDKASILLMGALPEAPTKKWLDTL